MTSRKRKNSPVETTPYDALAELYQALFDRATEGIFIADGQGQLIEVNPYGCEMVGYTREEILNLSWQDMIPPQELARNPLHLEELRAGKTVLNERWLRCKDGRLLPVEINTRMLSDDSLLGMVRDISERKHLEAQLLEGQERFRLLSESSITGIYLIQEDRFRYVNPALARMFGYTVAELVDRRGPLDLVYLDDRPLIADNMRRRLDGEVRETHYDFRGQRKDGSMVHIEVHGRRIEYQGKMGLLGTLVDITERKQAEMQVQASEQLFRTLVENSPDFIARYDREFRRIYLNPALQKLFRKPAEEILNQTPADESPLYAPQVYIDQLRQVIETASERTIEMPLGTSQSGIHWGHVRFVPEFGPDGQVASVLAIARNIDEVKAKEQHFQTLAENFPDFVIRFDRDARLLYVNPAVEKAFGLPTAAFIGKTLPELPQHHRSEQNESLLELLHRAFDEGVSNNAEICWDTQMGQRIFEIRHVPEKDAAGNVISVLGIAHDITERKQAEEALQLTRFTVESVADAVYWINPEARIIDVNKAACDMLGYSHNELCRLSLADIDPGFSMAQWSQVWEYIQTVGKSMIESMHRTKTGRLIPVEIIANFVKFGDQELDCAVVRDITERKQVEAQLRTSEARYRALVQSQVDLVSRYLPDTTLTFVNDAYCQFYGKKREDLIGLSYLTMVAPEFHEMTLKETESLVQEPRSIAGEYLNYTWDGRPCWIHWIIQSIVDENGQVIELQATGRDITPLKRAEEEIRKLNKELEQRVTERTTQLEAANRELEAFAYSVSHDLRAPLRHIDGFLELLQKRIAPTLDERSQHYMSTISTSAKQMGTLIDDLLSFSRMGRSEMSKKPVDLAALVQEVIRQLEPETQDRTVRWHIADLPAVSGDQAMLRMVLVNLLANALKFTRGCPQAEIEIGCQPGQDSETIFFVGDNGAGFDMAYADKLFGVFQRLHGVEEFEGTGIGLANVRRIIHRHGGRTWAEGIVNQGATFYFSLPQQT